MIKEVLRMIIGFKETERPYQLTGPAYAVWYDVGRILNDPLAQSEVGGMLCKGSTVLPEGLDPLTAVRIVQIAASRGMFVCAAAQH